jgi:hypothetical protein
LAGYPNDIINTYSNVYHKYQSGTISTRPILFELDKKLQTANLTQAQLAAIQQLRTEGEALAQNDQLRGAIDSLNTAIKMLGLKDRLYLNIPLGYTAP